MFARLIESHEIAHEVRHFTFEVPDVGELPYRPGQFVSLSREISGKEDHAARTRLRLPQAGIVSNCALIACRMDCSRHFCSHLQPGDTVPMKGPLGYFTWREPVRDSILVATGTGIAPFRGMMHATSKPAGSVKSRSFSAFATNLLCCIGGI